MSLLTNLVSYWKLDEASGTRIDIHGSNDLTDNNTVGSATGIINSAGSFVRANNEYLSCASNSTLQVGGNQDFTITCWAKFTTVPAGYMALVSKDNAASTRDYSLFVDGFGAGLCFTQNVTAAGDIASVGSTPSTATWYFLVGWYDSSNGQVHLRVNDTTTYNSANTGRSTTSGASEFEIGRSANTGDATDGLIDEVGFWKRLLTAGEITQLYNSGAGLAYSFGVPLLTQRRTLSFLGTKIGSRQISCS